MIGDTAMTPKKQEHNWIDDAFREEDKNSEDANSSSNRYDWLDDPFDDTKQAQNKLSKGSKKFLGFGCLGVVILFLFLGFLFIQAGASLGSVLLD